MLKRKSDIKPVELNFYSMDYGSGINDIMKEIEIKLKDTIKVRPRFHVIDSEK